MSKKESRNPTKFLYTILAIIAVIVAIVWIQSDGKEPSVESTEATETKNAVEVPQINYDYMLRSEWDGLERAEKNIQVLGEGQVIVPGIVQDPTDKNTIYFASAVEPEIDGEAYSTVISVYKYNTNDYTFERLYKRTAMNDYSEDSPNSLYNGEKFVDFTSIIGYQDGNLVLKLFPSSADVTCYPLHRQDALGKPYGLNINEPYSGNVDVSIPEDIYKQLEQRILECEE